MKRSSEFTRVPDGRGSIWRVAERLIRARKQAESFALCLCALFLLPVAVQAQGLTPSALLKPSPDSWPTYNGDYSGRRYSPLTQINSSNVHTLSMSWATRFSAGGGGGGRGGGFGG